MNKIYRLKFDKRRNELVVVSEITTGMSKEKSTGHLAELTALSPFRKLLGTLTPLALLTGLIISLFPGMALANPDLPTGGQIVGGQGSISTSGNQMTIHQQTQNMATNWHSFDIGKNNTVQFVQPDSSSVALNRVTGGSGSQIMGTLKANGQVFILNPNGVLFGKDARVNVAGLVASTKNINTADFMKGKYMLSGEGNPDSQVVNQGSLTSKGGYIVLAGERVSNSGTVTTPGGKTVLAAGKTVTLQLDNGGLTSVSVDGSVVNALVENRGLISATNGQVYLTAKGKDMLLNTVVNNSGTVEAKGLESRGGEIVLNGGDSGVVSQSGTLLADSHTGQGGKITLEGQNIHLAGNSLTSATGKTGGGEAYVGGGWQGKDSRIKNASKVVMDKTATIDVSATDAGNGGTAVLWSEDYTNFRGAVLAKGGTQSGNGGRVETSSYKNLQAFGDVETSARAGKGGEWLLDPTNVTIVSASDNTNVTENNADNGHIFSPSVSGAKVSAGKISEQLNKEANVTIQTSGVNTEGQQGNITIADNVNITKSSGTGDATLTLLADKNIQVGSATDGDKSTNISISSTSGKLNLKLLAGKTVNDGSAKVLLGKQSTTVSLNGGDFTVASAQDGGKINFLAPHGDGESITAGNISITAMGTEGMNTLGLNLNASGNIDISAGNITSASTWGQNVTWMAGGHLTATSEGGASFWANDKAHGGGKTTLSAVNDVVIKSNNGTMNMDGTGQGSIIDIISSKGSVSLSGTNGQNVKGYGGHDALILTKVNITSEGKTTLDGLAFWAKAAELTSLNITAGGDVNINGTAKRLADNQPGGAKALGIKLSGSNIVSTGGNITLTGFAATDKSFQDISTLEVSSSNLTANSSSGKISLNGTTQTTTGLKLTGSKLNAASLDVKGVATIQGTGFSLTDSQLRGGLTDWTNVTFSSAGSADGVKNRIGQGIVTVDNREGLMKKWHPENITILDMGNATIFDDTSKPTKGWTADYSSLLNPNGGWIFNNAKVMAGGDVSLTGVGFTNSNITLGAGNLNINNSGSTDLSGTEINVANGGVQVGSDKGKINLYKGGITAQQDIILTAQKGPVSIIGADYSNRNIIKSNQGNVSISAGGGYTAVNLTNVNVTASDGNILIDGVTANRFSGVRFNNVDMTANSDNGKISVTAKSSGMFDDYEEYGSLYFGSTNKFTSHSMSFDGSNLGGRLGSGVAFIKTNNTFDGNVNITGTGGKGVSFRTTSLNFKNGDVVISGVSNKNADGSDIYYGAGAIYFDGWSSYDSVRVNAVLNNASLTMKADSSEVHSTTQKGVGAFAISGVQSSDGKTDYVAGMTFSGNGDVKLIGHSSDGTGVDARYFNNINLNGNMEIEGTSNTGAGVNLDGKLDVNLKGATITGTSNSSTGVNIITGASGDSVVNLGNNKITGNSEKGAGIVINGKNVTITNGVLKGTVTAGTRPGISLQGGEAFTLDGVKVTGEAADGAGVSVSGTLTVNNGTSVRGTASGTGAGIAVDGTLSNTSGDGVSLDGEANSGDGILVKGETSLSNATITGTSVIGNGANIIGPLALSGTTSVKGKSTTGPGLNIAKTVTVAEADRDKISFTGESMSGTGVKLGSEASVSGGRLTATSVDGPGLQVENGAHAANVEINAQTVNGQAIAGDDNALVAAGNTSISTVGEAGNTNISGSVTPGKGETPAGVVAEVLADKLRESIATLQNELNKKLAGFDGLQQLQVQFDQTVRTGAIGQPDLKRLETLVNGLSDSLHTATELKDAISSLTVGDVGTLKERQETADHLSAELQGLTLSAAGDISAVAGELNAAKTLQSATVSLQGSLAARADEDGKVRHLLNSLQQQLKDAQEKGTAGGAVLAGMQAQLESLDLQQRSYEETLARIRQSLATVSQDGSSPVTERQDSVNRLQTALSGVSGISDGQVSALGNQLQQATTGYAQLVTAVQQQGSVNAQTPLQNRDQQDGFHAGGEPTVPVHGYQAQLQNVDIRLCDGEGCRSVTLDVAKPSQGPMVASTESR
ncbi:filamentous hemagglutinin N-terminal domain-containing protein [Salmonella enterica]|nr:filamentous hemagglutinin N-terminal domain-containing protein [Salmonella enterica]EKB5476533.1 filamentous hemagglutinin N-terminal domain-containing protein [Salmonella enterica]ELL0515355.1 filamentous hemagglutinin N-terminal domain-containing protein [Salmonella enterica]